MLHAPNLLESELRDGSSGRLKLRRGLPTRRAPIVARDACGYCIGQVRGPLLREDSEDVDLACISIDLHVITHHRHH